MLSVTISMAHNLWAIRNGPGPLNFILWFGTYPVKQIGIIAKAFLFAG